jgi:hypothetical protein
VLDKKRIIGKIVGQGGGKAQGVADLPPPKKTLCLNMMTGCLPKVSKKAEEDTEGDDDEDAVGSRFYENVSAKIYE